MTRSVRRSPAASAVARLAAAGIGAAAGVAAVLRAFRRVDAEQPDAVAREFERVAVDHARASGEGLAGARRRLGGGPRMPFVHAAADRRDDGDDDQRDEEGRTARHGAAGEIMRQAGRCQRLPQQGGHFLTIPPEPQLSSPHRDRRRIAVLG